MPIDVDRSSRKSSMLSASYLSRPPFTHAVREALRGAHAAAAEADLLFLEAWEMQPSGNLGATLRAAQIRRANPSLAAAIDAEVKAVQAAAPRLATARTKQGA
jgi:hypothetical protein